MASSKPMYNKPIGPKNNNNPLVKYTWVERYLRYVDSIECPFKFLDRFGNKFQKKSCHVSLYDMKERYNRCKNNYLKKLRCKKVLKEKPKISYPSNRFTVLENLEGVSYTPSFEERYGITFGWDEPSVRKFNYKQHKNYKEYAYIKKCRLENKGITPKKDNIKIRNLFLLTKLKEKIDSLMQCRLTKSALYTYLDKKAKYLIKFNTYKDKLTAQMDAPKMGPSGEDVCPEVASFGNTLNEAQRDASVGSPAKKVSRKKRRFNKLASAESSPDYGNLTNRFFPHKTYVWKKSDALGGTPIVDLTLPYDFVISHPNSANCTLFSSYAYWDGDMEVKIMLNSNKFQVGQLQMAWYYGQDYEKNFDRRNNVYTASQQAHCLVSASTSNEGILYIPFRYYKPKMGTKMRSDDPGRLNMGRLTVRVLNELDNPSTVYNQCNFTVSFRFINSNFSGMVARDLGKLQPQMMPALVRTAMHMLEELDMDPQRDNPPDVRPPSAMVPWSSHSWSVGDQLVEPLNTLRFQAPGQTPHPAEVTPELDEMRVDYISNIFGLVKIVKWSVNHDIAQPVFAFSGSPILDKTNYHTSTYDGTLCYAYPPIACLSHLFAYWRGTIELRIDVISTPFHTGRLLIGYVPRVLEHPTLEQIKSSPHEIIDLQGENRQFTFKIPYIADRPWWPTTGFNQHILAPSQIYCFILNELIPIDNVTNYIELNIYMRGCDDFELSVPVAPRIGLSTFNTYVNVTASSTCNTKNGYTPMYAGDWRYVVDGKKVVLRYGNVTDHVVQFDRLMANTVYVVDEVKNGKPIRGPNNVTIWYIVGLPVDQSNNFCPYATVFTHLDKAQHYALNNNNTEFIDNYTGDGGYFDYMDGTAVSGEIYFKVVAAATEVDNIVIPEIQSLAEYNTNPSEVIATSSWTPLIGNMDERISADTTCATSMLPSVASTSSGLTTFGENFNHLKALGRRYQMYYTQKQVVQNSAAHTYSTVIPLLPQGMEFDNGYINATSFFNVNREGTIPIIASAFRFYRGGLRFRLVWRSDFDCIIRIEHRPDERLESMSITPHLGHRKCYNNGYAIMMQSTTLNRILEFEIPFYQCGILGYLQNPEIKNDLESYHFSLGNLYIGFNCINASGKKNVQFDLYYSLADDCRFSVFQGFPPMMSAPDRLIAQMGLFGDVKDAVQTIKKVGKLADKVDTVIENATAGPSSLPDLAEDALNTEIPDAKTNIIDFITKTVPSHLKAMMINAFSQIMHCFINPCAKTIAWAFASFLANVGILCANMVETFCKYFKKLMNWAKNYNIRSQANETKNPLVPEKLVGNMAESDDMPLEIKAGLVGTVVSSIAAVLGFAAKTPKNIPDFFTGCWTNIGKWASTSNHLCTFFKNNLVWITRAYKWVVRKLFPNKALAVELQDSDQEIKSFATEALILLDESNARKIEIHPKWNLRVYSCAAHASVILMKMTQAKNAPRTPALLGLARDMIKKRDELVRFQLSPPVRFEPFVIYFGGASNIGKSHLCQEIGQNLLRKINFKTYEELIYTRTPGNPYWNNLRNQPICLYDDFCAIGGEYGLLQASELFCLKSRAIFNPPQAEIKDKFIRYNPLLVFLASNQMFPKMSGIECMDAFYRRRDCLIKVEKNISFYKSKGVDCEVGTPKDFKKQDIKNYEHLKFRIAKNVMDSKTDYDEALTYAELVQKLEEDFVNSYSVELEKYNEAIKCAFEFYPDDGEDGLSISENVDKLVENVAEVNSFRFNNVTELKVWIQKVIVKITHKNDVLLPILLTQLDMFKAMDPVVHDIYVNSNEIVKSAILERSLGLVANMSDEDSDDEEIDPIAFKKFMEARKPKQPAMIAMPDFCPHSGFDPDWDFVREDHSLIEGKSVHTGYFHSTLYTKTRIPETVCEHGKCAWSNEKTLSRDMFLWLNQKYTPQRRLDLERGNYMHLPFWLVKHLIANPDALNQVQSTRAEEVFKEIETWSQWAKRIISEIGSGLWTTLKWAAKIIGVLSICFGLTGWAYNRMYPEESNVRMITKLNDTCQNYETSKQSVLGALDATQLVNAEIMAGKHFTQDLFPTLSQDQGQMQASGDYKTYGKSKADVKDIAIKMVGDLTRELEYTLTKLIKRNTIFIQARYDTKILTGRLIGLTDHYALSVDHYDDKFANLPDNAHVYLVGRGFHLEVKYKEIIYKKFKNSSLGYYIMPNQVPPFKNLIKHIASQKDHRSVGPKSVLIEPTVDGDVIVTNLTCQKTKSVFIEASLGFDEFFIPDGYKYAKGGRGMCGSLLLSDHLQNPIYGIHVAGDIGGRVGVSEAICREDFQFMLDKAAIKEVYEPNMLLDSVGIYPRSDVLLLGQVPKSMAHHQPTSSKVIPTECHGEIFPVYCQPPVLSEHDPRISDNPYCPLQQGINKHGLVTLNFPQDLVDLAYDDLLNLILAKVKPVRHEVGKLSKATAIIGNINIEGFEKLDLSTSEGFPYVACRPKNADSKKWLLNLSQNEKQEYQFESINPFLRDVCKLKKKQRLARTLPFTVFVDCLKDRKLPTQKAITPGKVRIFSISPLDYTIQCRQYFMDFSVSYQNTRLDVEHGVGIDVNSYEWTDLANRLLNKGSDIVTADYSGYGPSLNAVCAQKAFDIIREWYKHNGDENVVNDLMREMLGYEAIHSVHLCKSTVYRTLCGLPSGGPLTVICNTLVNCLYVRIAWLLAMKSKPDYSTLTSFHTHCVMFGYGDDLIIAVSPEIKELFNCLVIADILNLYHISIKNATKGDEIIKYLPLLSADTTFLKNQFLPHPTRRGYFLAALDKTSVEDTLNWTFRAWQHKMREISLEASDACIRSAFGHGPGYYGAVRNKVFKYWMTKSEKLNTPTWSEIDQQNYA